MLAQRTISSSSADFAAPEEFEDFQKSPKLMITSPTHPPTQPARPAAPPPHTQPARPAAPPQPPTAHTRTHAHTARPRPRMKHSHARSRCACSRMSDRQAAGLARQRNQRARTCLPAFPGSRLLKGYSYRKFCGCPSVISIYPLWSALQSPETAQSCTSYETCCADSLQLGKCIALLRGTLNIRSVLRMRMNPPLFRELDGPSWPPSHDCHPSSGPVKTLFRPRNDKQCRGHCFAHGTTAGRRPIELPCQNIVSPAEQQSSPPLFQRPWATNRRRLSAADPSAVLNRRDGMATPRQRKRNRKVRGWGGAAGAGAGHSIPLYTHTTPPPTPSPSPPLLPHCVQSLLSPISRDQAPCGHHPPNTSNTVDRNPPPP